MILPFPQKSSGAGVMVFLISQRVRGAESLSRSKQLVSVIVDIQFGPFFSDWSMVCLFAFTVLCGFLISLLIMLIKL